MEKTSLGDRIKEYESVPSLKLVRRTPVIIRLDGKAFHTFTRGMERPFDDALITTMQETTQALVKNIEGCEFGYTQSDEISLLLTDYKRLETQAWFDYKVQKMVSIAASMCAAYFAERFYFNFQLSDPTVGAYFDARAFNIPKEEVANYFILRQQDCTRNSIQMVGQDNFSHKELHEKSCDDIQEMLWQTHKINWNDIETHKKRGTCVYKNCVYMCPICKAVCSPPVYSHCTACQVENVQRTEYKIDKDIPIFTQDRNFVQKWVDVDKE